MYRWLTALAVLATAAVAVSAEANLKQRNKNGDKICFIGDSITANLVRAASLEMRELS